MLPIALMDIKPIVCKTQNKWNSKQSFISRDKVMPEIHLRIPGFTYSACETFTKNNEVM